MSDSGWIEPIVERVVGQALESHVAQLRGDIVRRVMEEVASQPERSVAAASNSSAADLARAVSQIQAGSSQKEILRALLDSSSSCAARVALFVVKGTHATGWQSRGFANNDGIKDFTLDSNAPAVVRAITERVAASASAAELDRRFVDAFGSSANGEAWMLPLILKDKVAALVYADGGTEGTQFDHDALEVLVLATSAWLEVNALRKQAHKEPSAAAGDGHIASAPEPAKAFNDPFAAHAPAFAMAAAASQSSTEVAAPEPVQSHEQQVVAEPHTTVTEVQSAAAVAEAAVAAEPLPIGHAEVATQHESPSPSVAIPNEDQELHRKAQRFARLLVDEIKLYNQAKVSEGRKNKDLYDRLKDTVEKSRSTYQKRYGNTVAASGNYFQHELIRSLAEDDISIMGPNFRL